MSQTDAKLPIVHGQNAIKDLNLIKNESNLI